MTKLTKVQRGFLAEVDANPMTASPDYPPVKKLVAEGFISGTEFRRGWSYPTYRITPAGREALAAARARQQKEPGA